MHLSTLAAVQAGDVSYFAQIPDGQRRSLNQ
jgi:hypothetical protein